MNLFDSQNFKEKMSGAKVYLPAQYFIDFDDEEDVEANEGKILTHNGQKYILVHSPDIQSYSFAKNEIKFDSDWYGDFLIEF